MDPQAASAAAVFPLMHDNNPSKLKPMLKPTISSTSNTELQGMTDTKLLCSRKLLCSCTQLRTIEVCFAEGN